MGAKAVEVLRLVCSSSLPSILLLVGKTCTAADPIVLALALVCKSLHEAATLAIYEVIQLEHTMTTRNGQLARTLSAKFRLASLVRTIHWHCQDGATIISSASSVAVLKHCPEITSLLINTLASRTGPWVHDIYTEMPFKDRLCSIEVTLGDGAFWQHLRQFIPACPHIRHLILHRRALIPPAFSFNPSLPDLHPDSQLTLLSIHDDVNKTPLREAIKYLTTSAHSLKVLELDFTSTSGFAPSQMLKYFTHLRLPMLRCLIIGDISRSATPFEWVQFFNSFPCIRILGIKHVHQEGYPDHLTNLFTGLNEAKCMRALAELDIQSTAAFSLQNFGFLTKIDFRHLSSLILLAELVKPKQCIFPTKMVPRLHSFLNIMEPLLVQEMQAIFKAGMLPSATVFRIARKATPMYQFTRADKELQWVNDEFEGDERVWKFQWNARYQAGSF